MQSRIVKDGRQLYLIPEAELIPSLDPRLWHGCFNARESTLQQLSPYVGKLKSGMVRVLVSLYSEPGDVILDPFCGSGVVPLESLLCDRQAWANDLSPYAYVLTLGKLQAPGSAGTAIEHAGRLADRVEQESPNEDIAAVPEWVSRFFHPTTLREVVTAFRISRQQEEYFLLACLLGILHHVRPGFLSYPASHLVPYLRTAKYPPDQFAQMYAYRDLRSRLLAKVRRAYRRPMLGPAWEHRRYRVWNTNSMELPIADACVDAIVSSPPYFGALDYARDNRLRLWFLGCNDWKELDAALTANNRVYLPQMSICLREMNRVLRLGKCCVLVLGDFERDGQTQRTAELLSDLAAEVTSGQLVTEAICDDRIPDERRSRRRTRTTKFERILVMRKR